MDNYRQKWDKRDYELSTLDNGLKVLTLQMNNSEDIMLTKSFVSLAINAGKNEEKTAGLSELFQYAIIDADNTKFVDECLSEENDGHHKLLNKPDGLTWTFAFEHKDLERCLELFADTLFTAKFSNILLVSRDI
jgi:hypothetical protein